jgi:hypothetical protein
MNAHQSNLAKLAELINEIPICRAAKGESEQSLNATSSLSAGVLAEEPLVATLPPTVPCKSCSKDHEPIDKFYLGRERWVCSEACWEEYLNFGRYGQ